MKVAIFDFDGLLVDSEPLWRRMEVRELGAIGVEVTEAECEATTGLRIDEVVAHWRRERPWTTPEPEVVVARIVDAMVRGLREAPEAKPGVRHAVETCRAAGLRLAVASSSPSRLLDAGLEGLGLRGLFERVVSAEHERFGKPHPAVFLRTADELGVEPTDCVVFEDSLNGCLAAKAARMRCVAVPEREDPRFVIADVVLRSLEELRPEHLRA